MGVEAARRGLPLTGLIGALLDAGERGLNISSFTSTCEALMAADERR